LSASIGRIGTIEHTAPPVASVSVTGNTLNVFNIPSGDTIILEGDGNEGLQVFDSNASKNSTTLLDNKTFEGITVVNVNGSSNNGVLFNDSHGMPLIAGSINLSGGINLTLTGDAVVAGNETFVAGSTAATPGAIYLPGPAGAVDLFFSAGTGVTDELPISGVLKVIEEGNAYVGPVVGNKAEISGMGPGGGDFLLYANKPYVELSADGPNTTTTVGTVAATGENSFQVFMNASGETTNIDETSFGVSTFIWAYGKGDSVYTVNNQSYVGIWCYGSDDTVTIASNKFAVQVQGNSTTTVTIGAGDIGNGSTRGIDANIDVNGAQYLNINDTGNSGESMTVSNGTITGKGLFGNNSVTIYYEDVGEVTGPTIPTL
jgi:hypothetical protein